MIPFAFKGTPAGEKKNLSFFFFFLIEKIVLKPKSSETNTMGIKHKKGNVLESFEPRGLGDYYASTVKGKCSRHLLLYHKRRSPVQ